MEKVTRGAERVAELAPGFDHASSLGRELTDRVRDLRVSARDRGFSVEAYARRGRSQIYGKETDRRSLCLLETFEAAARLDPVAGRYWLGVLDGFEGGRVEGVLAAVPEERMTDAARKFALHLVQWNREALLGMVLG